MNTIKIVEVGPRDGLQNEKTLVPTEIKLELIRQLSETGLSVIEATSFVSPQWVPQMADHSEIMRRLVPKTDIQYPVLIPNLKGMENALALNVKTIAVFTAASETFSEKNTNCSIAGSLQRIQEIIVKAKQRHIPVRGYVSCVLGCPYEGEIHPRQVIAVATKLHSLGCYEISLGDTIGVGTPIKARNLIAQMSKEIPVSQLAVHFHDTYGQALTNIYACLDQGITTIDSSIGGLGGCPYAPGAGGNVATEDVIYMLHGMGLQTHVNLPQLIEVDRFIFNYLGRTTRSKVAQAWPV